MAKKLLIVESPAKARTIKKILGKDYIVASSFGHIADLPENDLGINIDQQYRPEYRILPKKKKLLKELKNLTQEAEEVFLASDEDREGEAIAWHLKNFLQLDDKAKRIVFHEITDKAIKDAIKNPRNIDINLVNAQQARRVLDRLVGYMLSPVLWKKIKKGLSAGRVQSVALRLIADREDEIRRFQPKSYFKVEGEFTKKDDEKVFRASLAESPEDEKEVEELLRQLAEDQFFVGQIQKKTQSRNPQPPFTTSTLQQEASSKLGFSVNKTMRVAQYLYENGYITYMRTDSVHLADTAIEQAKEYILKNFGEKYARPRQYTTRPKNAQEAHEAIRPTNIFNDRPQLDKDAAALYDLIWKRTVASQMAPAKIQTTHVTVTPAKTKRDFKTKGEIIKFDGYLKVYGEITSGANQPLPNLKEGEPLDVKKIIAQQKFTRPPLRYNEAMLVKKMEELGIGRPSTYAPTIGIIQKRGYVEKKNIPGIKKDVMIYTLKGNKISQSRKKETYGGEKKKLVPTDMGLIVNDFLEKNFQNIIDYNFTAEVEDRFDEIARGKSDWINMIDEFYKSFSPQIENVVREARREHGEKILGEDPQTGKKVRVKYGPYGPLVQLGEANDKQKPQFASIPSGKSMRDLTLDEALFSLSLSKKIGELEGEDIILGQGKYGPYIKYKNAFISLPAHMDLFNVTENDAISVIQQKLRQEEPIAFHEEQPVYYRTGKYGPYLRWGKLNVKLPSGTVLADLTPEKVAELITQKLEQEKKSVLKNWPEENITLKRGRRGYMEVLKDGERIGYIPYSEDWSDWNVEDVMQRVRQKKKKS